MLRFPWFASLVLFALCISVTRGGDQKSEGVSFTRDVAPIFVKHCQACHGDKEPKGGFQLYTFELLTRPGDSDLAPVTGGKLDESEIYRLIVIDDKDQRMPKEADPLPAEKIAVIKKWIEGGAKFD